MYNWADSTHAAMRPELCPAKGPLTNPQLARADRDSQRDTVPDVLGLERPISSLALNGISDTEPTMQLSSVNSRGLLVDRVASPEFPEWPRLSMDTRGHRCQPKLFRASYVTW